MTVEAKAPLTAPSSKGRIRLPGVFTNVQAQVWAFIAAVIALFIFLAAHAFAYTNVVGGIHVPFPFWMAISFFACYAGTSNFSARGQGQRIQFSEVVWVVGIYFATPFELCVALMLGEMLAFGLLGMRLQQLVYNIFHHVAVVAACILIFHYLADISAPYSLHSLLILTLVGGLNVVFDLLTVGVLTIATRSFDFAMEVRKAVAVAPQILLCTALGVCAVVILPLGLYPLLLLTLAGVVFVLFLRIFYIRQEQLSQMNDLQEVTNTILTATKLSSATGEYLLKVAQLLNAKFAILELYTAETLSTLVHSTHVKNDEVVFEGIIGAPSTLTTEILAALDDTGIATIFRNQNGPALREVAEKYDVYLGGIIRIGSAEKPQGLILLGANHGMLALWQREMKMLVPPLISQTQTAFEKSLITSQLEIVAQEKLAAEETALHDSLTKLPNRELFNQRAAAALQKATQYSACALLFIDLDGFKAVNDTHGHAGGDEVLIAVAHRLEAVLRIDDTAARFGGDEFAVLLQGLPSRDIAIRVAERILESVRQPIPFAEGEGRVRASIGIMVAKNQQVPLEKLMQLADEAMYEAKKRGKDQYVLA